MELESLFVDQKWNILQSVSIEEQSPLQLAKRLNTTIANVSQQLRFLEAARLVDKRKIPNRDKGKPRSLFSLSKDYAYLISLMDGFTHKRLLPLTDYHKIILKIWFLENPNAHYSVERFFWRLEPFIGKIDSIALSSGSTVKVFIVADRSLHGSLAKLQSKDDPTKMGLEFFTPEEAERLTKAGKRPFEKDGKTIILYDPGEIISGGDLKEKSG